MQFGAFNQEKALRRAYFVIVKTPHRFVEALLSSRRTRIIFPDWSQSCRRNWSLLSMKSLIILHCLTTKNCLKPEQSQNKSLTWVSGAWISELNALKILSMSYVILINLILEKQLFYAILMQCICLYIYNSISIGFINSKPHDFVFFKI